MAVPDVSYEVWDEKGQLICRGGCSGAPSDAACKGKGRTTRADADARVCGPPQRLGGPCCPQHDKAARQGAACSGACGSGAPEAAPVVAKLPWLDRLLPLWIVLAMVGGILLGCFVPGVGENLMSGVHVGDVSLPIAIGLWIMMWPVLTKVRYELLGRLLSSRATATNLAVSAALNWLLGPALMTGLAWACLPDLPAFRSGVVMVGLARCIAMVLIWNQLALGDSEMCAVMVAFNSVLQIILYAPLSILYIQIVSGGGSIDVGFWPVARSVLLFLGVPLAAGILLRLAVIATAGRRWFEDVLMPWFGPWALIGLLYTIVVMFASQGKAIISELGNVARVSVPMLIYFGLMFALSFVVAWVARMPYAYAATQAFTAASNNFELAIAVAVATFGLQSSEALAATVGPLVEVPVLVSLVYVSLWVKRRWWDERDRQLASKGSAGPPLDPAATKVDDSKAQQKGQAL